MRRRGMELLMALLLLAGVFGLAREGALLAGKDGEGAPVIVLDAGHGGFDPGKIGVNGAEEKTLNLEITMLVKEKLEEEGMEIVLTREDDTGLYDENTTNKKVQDLQRRCDLIHKTAPVCAVSIHQNSYTSEAVNGPQVFYYTHSTEGKRLAEYLQTALVDGLAPESHRQVKGNTSYYLLKKTDVPTAIVECGFLSNPEEARLLTDADYQEKVAAAIRDGVLAYIKETQEKGGGKQIFT